jgi:hypothetical protein
MARRIGFADAAHPAPMSSPGFVRDAIKPRHGAASGSSPPEAASFLDSSTIWLSGGETHHNAEPDR